jgi:ankyrin repeat protein
MESSNEVLGPQLIYALKTQDFRRATSLVEKGANLNAADKYGDTPLMFAARHGDTEIAQLLIPFLRLN